MSSQPQSPAPRAPTPVGAKPPRRMNRRHEEVLAWVLLNPGKTQRELARDLNYSESWLSVLMNTDMFQERLNQMRETYHSTAVIGIRSRTEAAATLAINRLIEVLENDQGEKLSHGFILEATTKLLERIEKNEQPQDSGQNGVTVNLNVAQEIQTAMHAVRSAQQQLPPIEHHSDESSDSETVEPPIVEPES